jgi:hypothetical protein
LTLQGIYHSPHARAGLTVDTVDSLDDLKAVPIIQWDCGVPQLLEQRRKQLFQLGRTHFFAL